MLNLKFWTTPIRMSLGGICLETHLNRWDAIASAIADPNSRDRMAVRPIVLANSVAAMHCKNRLNFKDSQLTQIERTGNDIDILAKRLVGETRDLPDVIPVVVADELSSFRVLNSPLLDGRGFSIFDMISQRAARNSELRREMPQHYKSFAIKRQRSDGFQEYMQDALTHFLLTEPETTAIQWGNLAKRFLDEICNLPVFPQPLTAPKELQRAERWRIAWEWVQYTLHLDRSSMESYSISSGLPWKPVLLCTRTMMQEHFASGSKTIEDQVKLSYSICRNAKITPDEVRKLHELFDVEVGSDKHPEDEKELAYNLHLKLLGSFRSLGTVIRECEAATAAQADLFAIRAFMRNLQAMYESIGKPESGTRIDRDITKLSEMYSGKKGRIILATGANGTANVALGVVFLDFSGNAKPKEAELRFMWVKSVYRQFGVGGRLLSHGVDLARFMGCAAIKVEILPELQTAIDLVQRHGFVVAPNREPHFPGRVVLVREL